MVVCLDFINVFGSDILCIPSLSDENHVFGFFSLYKMCKFSSVYSQHLESDFTNETFSYIFCHIMYVG